MFKKLFIIFTILIGLGFSTVSVYADTDLIGQINAQINAGAGKAEFVDVGKASDPRMIIVNVINIALQTVGTIFIILVLYAAYNLITARGDEEKIKKAMGIIRPAIIGLVIILISYSITYFISTQLSSVVSKTGQPYENSK